MDSRDTAPDEAERRETADADWRALTGRTGETLAISPVYRLRLAGPAPSGLLAIPKDNRPADVERGQAILAGRWRFGSSVVETPSGHAPWGPPFPSLHFSDRIHRFHWLRDVAAAGPEGEAHARLLTASWIEAFGKWDAFAWRLSAAADRLINILSAGPWLMSGFDDAGRDALLDTLARHMRHLQASGGEESGQRARLRIGAALSLAGAAMDDGKALEAGLHMLEVECAAQILADGGHISRSPEALADVLLDIEAVEDLLLRLGRVAPAFLTKLQPRMAAMLSFFSLPDSGLLAVNGGGDGAHGLAHAALRPHGGAIAKFAFARLSGFQRVQAEELTIYMDTGEGPPRPHGAHAHAGALALTIDDGPERIVTSCAAHADLEPVFRDAARRTAAHSVLSLNGEDSAVFSVDPVTGLLAPEGPAGLAVRRMEEGDQYLLEAQHGGWRAHYGLLYRRRLYVSKDGARVTGEDSVFRSASETAPSPGAPAPYAVRFHLHPSVQVAPGPDDRTLFLGLPKRQRVWRFRCESQLSVEASRYWGTGYAQKAHQIVIRGEADPAADGSEPPNRLRWALVRVEPGA